jgi:putative solute:sodium symporter small subunit
MNKAPPDRLTPRERRAWRHNLRWIAALLVIWFVVSFVVSWFARELRFDFFGWPFSFWVAAQGALIVYVLMTALYAWHMNRVDQEVDRPESEADAHPAPPADPTRRS